MISLDDMIKGKSMPGYPVGLQPSKAKRRTGEMTCLAGRDLCEEPICLTGLQPGQRIEFGGMRFRTPGPKFIEQFADLLVELHSLPHGPNFATYSDVPESFMRDDINDLVNWPDKDMLCEEALYDFYDIKSILDKRFYLHGDLWKENIIVDEEGNLSGLKDWKSFSYGDPHWDFRMIGRWMGWEALDKLLFLYNSSVNWNCKREYIEILDKISLQTERYLSLNIIK